MKHVNEEIGNATDRVAVLSVSPLPEDHLALERIFDHFASDPCRKFGWQVWKEATLPRALAALKQTPASVVLCERDLPGGNWRDLLEYATRLDDPPMIVITSRHADDYLWAEALNLGAYDVLAKPFCAAEVIRVLSIAAMRWYRNRQNHDRIPAGRQMRMAV
jgi:DNA-binding response OmpR family regulator